MHKQESICSNTHIRIPIEKTVSEIFVFVLVSVATSNKKICKFMSKYLLELQMSNKSQIKCIKINNQKIYFCKS